MLKCTFLGKHSEYKEIKIRNKKENQTIHIFLLFKKTLNTMTKEK